MKRKIKIIITIFIVAVLTFAAIGLYSYVRALNTADEIVKPIEEYFELDESRLLFTSGPDNGKMQLAFEFKYWNATAWDVHFYIYVSPFGADVFTKVSALIEKHFLNKDFGDGIKSLTIGIICVMPEADFFSRKGKNIPNQKQCSNMM